MALLTKEQAAERLRCCTKTIERRIVRSGLPARRLGNRVMIESSDLEEWLKKQPSAAEGRPA